MKSVPKHVKIRTFVYVDNMYINFEISNSFISSTFLICVSKFR